MGLGGSLDGVRGGRGMIEPAGCSAVRIRPYIWNFRDAAALEEVGGIDRSRSCDLIELPDDQQPSFAGSDGSRGA